MAASNNHIQAIGASDAATDSDSEASSSDVEASYRPISFNSDSESESDNPSPSDPALSSLDLNGRIEKEVEEEVVIAEKEREETIARAFREDEMRRNAPLAQDNVSWVMEAMRQVRFIGSAPDWADRVDEESWLDRLRRLRGHSYNQGEKVDSSKFETDPGSHRNSINSNNNLKSVYRCKKCRQIVAVQENVVSHTPSEGKCFSRQRRKNGNLNKDAGCTSLFVEPLKWMTTVEEGAVQGKLSCIKCDARLGYYNWYGTQCSCGSWVTPAFQIHKNRIDSSLECYN